MAMAVEGGGRKAYGLHRDKGGDSIAGHSLDVCSDNLTDGCEYDEYEYMHVQYSTRQAFSTDVLCSAHVKNFEFDGMCDRLRWFTGGGEIDGSENTYGKEIGAFGRAGGGGPHLLLRLHLIPSSVQKYACMV